MSKSWYLHTIDGKPAFYSERSGYICFANRRQNFPILVHDLRTIRRQQRQSELYRLHMGLPNDAEYSYITFPRTGRGRG